MSALSTQQTSDLNRLATRPVGRLLWEFSLPAVVGMLVMALYNVVDRIFIGRVVGPDAISGLAVTFPLMNITTAIGVLVGVGSSSRISIVLGRGDRSLAARILGNAATLTVLNAALYIICFAIWIDPILTVFGAGPNTIGPARTYMLWVLPGLFLTNVAFGLNNVLRASGYPDKAMYTMLIGAVANVILDAIMVLGLDMGMAGAALATDIAMLLSAIFVVGHFFRHDVNLHFTRGSFGLNLAIVWSIVTLGAAPSLINAASCLINALINNTLLKYGGELSIGAAGIFVTYTSLLTTIVLGVNMGLQPIIGYNYGAGHNDRVKQAFKTAVAAGTIICAVGSIAGIAGAKYIALAFTDDPTLLGSTVTCLQYALPAFSVVGLQIMTTCLFQSIGAPGKSMVLSLSRQVIFLIPLLYYLPQYMDGVMGVWLSFPISDILATVVTVALLLFSKSPLRQ